MYNMLNVDAWPELTITEVTQMAKTKDIADNPPLAELKATGWNRQQLTKSYCYHHPNVASLS